jgi:hypothetical protein
LTKERWEKLNSIGFDWGKQPSGWTARHQQAEKCKEEMHQGLCDNVPERCSGNNPPPHLHKLATGPLFNNTQKDFLERESVANLKTFPEILAYLKAHGNYNVPPRYPCNPLLARWVSEQRNIYDLKHPGLDWGKQPCSRIARNQQPGIYERTHHGLCDNIGGCENASTHYHNVTCET